jgi:hypothetical protein
MLLGNKYDLSETRRAVSYEVWHHVVLEVRDNRVHLNCNTMAIHEGYLQRVLVVIYKHTHIPKSLSPIRVTASWHSRKN